MRFAAKTAIPLIIGGLTVAAVTCSGPATTPAEPTEPGTVKVPAPIESVKTIVAESFPPQYFLLVKSGLPNGCIKFDSYEVTREGDTIRVTVTNLEPADKNTICTQVYGTVDSNIPLGSNFEPGKTYHVLLLRACSVLGLTKGYRPPGSTQPGLPLIPHCGAPPMGA